MNWKNMPLAHKIATVIAGLAVVVWLIAKVQPSLLPFKPPETRINTRVFAGLPH